MVDIKLSGDEGNGDDRSLVIIALAMDTGAVQFDQEQGDAVRRVLRLRMAKMLADAAASVAQEINKADIADLSSKGRSLMDASILSDAARSVQAKCCFGARNEQQIDLAGLLASIEKSLPENVSKTGSFDPSESLSRFAQHVTMIDRAIAGCS